MCMCKEEIHTDYTIKIVLEDIQEFVEQRSVLYKSSKSKKNMQNCVFQRKKKKEQGTHSALRMDKLRQIREI